MLAVDKVRLRTFGNAQAFGGQRLGGVFHRAGVAGNFAHGAAQLTAHGFQPRHQAAAIALAHRQGLMQLAIGHAGHRRASLRWIAAQRPADAAQNHHPHRDKGQHAHAAGGGHAPLRMLRRRRAGLRALLELLDRKSVV